MVVHSKVFDFHGFFPATFPFQRLQMMFPRKMNWAKSMTTNETVAKMRRPKSVPPAPTAVIVAPVSWVPKTRPAYGRRPATMATPRVEMAVVTPAP